MKNMSGIKTKYLHFVPLFGILPIVLLFLKFIHVEESSEQMTGFQIIVDVIQAIQKNGISLSYLFIIAIMVVLPLIIMLATIVAFFKPGKKILHTTILLYVLKLFGLILSLLTIKHFVDGMGYLQVEFLIKYLSFGFWTTFLVDVVGLIITMKSVKISSGYIVLTVMSVIWLFPIVWIILNSFRAEGGFYIGYFIPKKFTLNNYVKVWTDTSTFQFAKWYRNTLFVAISSCILTSFIVLSTAFTLSRIRFSGRRALMNLMLVLGMFPGFMSMIAVYYVIKGLGLTQSLAALVIVYSAGASLGYYVSKGFFDTIPRSLDEAAFIDGATKWQVFTRITIPLSKSIIIFTVLTSFMGPWADYIFSSIILGDNVDNYTVAIGLFNMLTRDNIEKWYTCFAAGAILIALPISALFLSLQRYYVEGLSGSVKG
ncbi:MAG: binding-protein-dependent transport system inner rane component [Firmicutes bacterium]|nr:binding-protein-dependent transport system inner rane component [Bacillota bacterium]